MQKKYIFRGYGKEFLSEEKGLIRKMKPKIKRKRKKEKKYIMVRSSYPRKMEKNFK